MLRALPRGSGLCTEYPYVLGSVKVACDCGDLRGSSQAVLASNKWVLTKQLVLVCLDTARVGFRVTGYVHNTSDMDDDDR